MCHLTVSKEINNIEDLKSEISRHIWRQANEFDSETILRETKNTKINIPCCTDATIIKNIQGIVKLFISTNHIINVSNKFLYL